MLTANFQGDGGHINGEIDFEIDIDTANKIDNIDIDHYNLVIWYLPLQWMLHGSGGTFMNPLHTLFPFKGFQ